MSGGLRLEPVKSSDELRVVGLPETGLCMEVSGYMSDPEISVCVTTFNHKDYIVQCLESVLSQRISCAVEILVGDDLSDDGTSDLIADLVTKSGNRIKHVWHASRLGGPGNTKALLLMARGRFIARLDGDDYWLAGKLQRQIDFLDENPDCAAVYTNALTIDEEGNPMGLFNDVGDARFDLAAMLRRGNFLNNSSVLFRAQGKQAWLSIDQPQIDYRVHLWHARNGFLAQLAEPLSVYRVNSVGSMVAQANDWVRTMYWEAILSVPRDRVTDDDFARGVTDFLRRVVLHAIRTRRWGLLREWAPCVFRVSPYGVIRTSILVAGSVIRIAGKELIGYFRKGPDGHRIKVSYRR